MRRKTLQVFLIIAISLFIPISQTYAHYYVLMEADFFSPNLSFENPDQEILPITKQDEANSSILSASPFPSSAGAIFAAPFYHFIFTLCSHHQETFVRRC